MAIGFGFGFKLLLRPARDVRLLGRVSLHSLIAEFALTGVTVSITQTISAGHLENGNGNLRLLDIHQDIHERIIIILILHRQETLVRDAQLAELLPQILVLVRVVQDADLVADGYLLVAVPETRLDEVFYQVVERGPCEVDVCRGIDDAANGTVGVWRRWSA
jgi:hypothetical protein